MPEADTSDVYHSCTDEAFRNDLAETLLDGANLGCTAWTSMTFEDFIKPENLSKPINLTINTTYGLLFHLILAYTVSHSLSSSARVNLFILFNQIFGCQILPATPYLLDKFLNPSRDAQFHAVCPNCGAYIGKFGSH